MAVITKAPPAPLDFAGFERFVAGRPPHERWELHDGVLAMQPFPTTIHQRVVLNIAYDLEQHAEAIGADWMVLPGARLNIRKGGRRESRIPDLVVTPAHIPHGGHIEDALFVVEVTSPGEAARRRDLNAKRDIYALLDSLDAYLVIDTAAAAATLFRQSDGFLAHAVTDPDAAMPVDALGFALTLRRAFRRTPLLG